jgi:hypothetical protein
MKRKIQAPRYSINISAGSSKPKLKLCNNTSRTPWKCGKLVSDLLMGPSSYPNSTWRGAYLSLIFPLFCWPRFWRGELLLKTKKRTPSCACGLIMGLFGCTVIMEQSLIESFFEKQIEIKSPAWIGNTTEGQASPSDCHKTAKVVSDESVLHKTYHTFFMAIRNLVSNLYSKSILIFNFNVNDIK